MVNCRVIETNKRLSLDFIELKPRKLIRLSSVRIIIPGKKHLKEVLTIMAIYRVIEVMNWSDFNI